MADELDQCVPRELRNLRIESGAELKRRFLCRIDTLGWFTRLFDHVGDLQLFMKDRKGRFILSNEALRSLFGVKDESELLGRTDDEFFPPDLCAMYAEDDQRVMRTEQPILEKLELVRNPDGTFKWHRTSKFPVHDRRGAVVGVGGVTIDLKKMQASTAPFSQMAPVIEAILNGYGEPISIPDLARSAGLSISQFERQFKRRFATTPLKYITQVRLNAACQLLAQTESSVADVAAQTGFCDQSHFTHQFVKHKGMTPSRYRRDFSAENAVK